MKGGERVRRLRPSQASQRHMRSCFANMRAVSSWDGGEGSGQGTHHWQAVLLSAHGRLHKIRRRMRSRAGAAKEGSYAHVCRTLVQSGPSSTYACTCLLQTLEAWQPFLLLLLLLLLCVCVCVRAVCVCGGVGVVVVVGWWGGGVVGWGGGGGGTCS